MKLRTRSFDFTFLTLIIASVLLFIGLSVQQLPTTFAESREAKSTQKQSADERFVTIYDQGKKLQFKTSATTVGNLLDRAKIVTHPQDIIEPDRNANIDSTNFYINIYRTRPVLVIDGKNQQIIQTASFDKVGIASSAGVTLYDGDKIKISKHPASASSVITATYEIIRQGGETITTELAMPAPEEKRQDSSLKSGQTKLIQVGEDGRKVVKYRVKFKNGKEESRQAISEQIIATAKPRIIAIGTQVTPQNNLPASSNCIEYVRAAGIAESDIPAALSLIEKESRCNPYAKNPYSGAYGIPQALPGNKMASMGADWQTNPVTQIKWMDKYVKTRYGGWQQALDFWHCIGSCRGVNKRSFWY